MIACWLQVHSVPRKETLAGWGLAGAVFLRRRPQFKPVLVRGEGYPQLPFLKALMQHLVYFGRPAVILALVIAGQKRHNNDLVCVAFEFLGNLDDLGACWLWIRV